MHCKTNVLCCVIFYRIFKPIYHGLQFATILLQILLLSFFYTMNELLKQPWFLRCILHLCNNAHILFLEMLNQFNHTTFPLRTIYFLFALKIVQLMRLILSGSLRFTSFSHFLLFSLKNFYFSIDQHFVTVDNAFKITTWQ